MDYSICYQLPNGHWYTKSCEDGGQYIHKLLKRGINEFNIQVWSRAKTIEMYRTKVDGEYTLVVSRIDTHYHTQKGIVNEYKINSHHMLIVGGQHLLKSC